MSTQYKNGDIVKGKVSGIQPYGAFIALDENTQGLVHISEIKHGFVRNIHEVLTIGQEVMVKIVTVDKEDNKISLSIRALEKSVSEQNHANRRASIIEEAMKNEGFDTLKDKLKQWILQSENEEQLKK